MQKPLFEVIVVATMSAGKSTVINALIGQELLHSANEATTATITRIHDKDHLSVFSGKAFSYKNELSEEIQSIDAQTLKRWNADPNIKTIDLVGDIQALQNDHAELVIYDTPGPNNSQDDNHEALTLEVINDGNYGLILYVLNATQLGVNDDRSLLEKIKLTLEKDPHKQIIFLLNKADCLDEEKGERLDKVVANANKYLTEVGFKQPTIIPTVAHYALVLQKVLNRAPLTRSERADLNNALENLNDNLIIASTIETEQKLKVLNKLKKTKTAGRVKTANGSSITKQRLDRAVMQTGFGVVQYLLQKKLEKTHIGSDKKPNTYKNDIRRAVIFNGSSTKIPSVSQEDKKTEIQPNLFKHNKENIMSHSIYIEHNPFTVETKFEVNGNTVDNWSFAETNKTRRLQLWVESLFAELYNLTNGTMQFSVQFKGVEADWLDIQAAAKEANNQGMSIQTQWIESEDPVTRLAKIQALMQEAQAHPIFADKLSDRRSKIHTDFEAALNKDFDVYVAATMSAGKSTLINAMLGSDLLPAANEATTATIAQITDNDTMPYGVFHGSRFNKDGIEVDGLQKVSLETLKEWNSKPDTKLIQLTGNIIGIKERENVRLVITDTPGPNNSQDPEHARTTMQHIQDSVRNPLILYILNATQLGTNDDQQVLGEIAKIMQKGGKQSKDRFIFVVNKMDNFDPESGENVEAALGRVRTYLENNGIENPLIYPVSANLTRLLRKREQAPDSLTRKERGDLTAMEDLFNEEPTMDLVQYMPLSSAARSNLKAKRLPVALERSGLPAIESMIDEYIDKYNLPNRVNRAYLALTEAVKVSSDENQLKADLQDHLGNLDVIEQQLKTLLANKDQSAKAKAKMEDVINDKKSLYPADAIKKIDDEEAKIRQMIYQFQDDFVGNSDELTPKQAERKIKILSEKINFESSRLINSLEQVIFEAQGITQQKLGDIFNNYVKDLFADIDGIPLPILDGLKAQVGNIATMTGLGLNSDEIEVRVTKERVKTGTEERYVKVGEREVSSSRWYNPFSWGSTRTEDVYGYKTFDVYEDRENRIEYVDADELWENRESEISHYFNELTKSAANKVTEDTQAYANAFKDFMEKEFKVKFDEIVGDLQARTADKAKVQAEADKAKATLQQIQDFKAKLDNVLAL